MITLSKVKNIVGCGVIIITIVYAISRESARAKAYEAVRQASNALTVPHDRLPTTTVTTATAATTANGLETIVLVPGAGPKRFELNGTKKLDWTPKTGDYRIRYIKMDGMPWRPPEADPNGWMCGNAGYRATEIYRLAGRIAEVQFDMPLTRVMKGEAGYVKVPCHPFTLQVTRNPKLTRYE